MSEFDLPVRFPHLREKEIAILKRYFEEGAPRGKWTIDFRYPLPDGRTMQDAKTPEEKAWIALNQKRSEAVCETGAFIYIIEVKQRVNSLALGQLLNYRDLYNKHFPAGKTIKLVCVAAEDDPAVRPSLEAHGIEVLIV